MGVGRKGKVSELKDWLVSFPSSSSFSSPVKPRPGLEPGLELGYGSDSSDGEWDPWTLDCFGYQVPRRVANTMTLFRTKGFADSNEKHFHCNFWGLAHVLCPQPGDAGGAGGGRRVAIDLESFGEWYHHRHHA